MHPIYLTDQQLNDLIAHWTERHDDLVAARGFEWRESPKAYAHRVAIWDRLFDLGRERARRNKPLKMTAHLVFGALPADNRLTIPVLYHSGCGDCS